MRERAKGQKVCERSREREINFLREIESRKKRHADEPHTWMNSPCIFIYPHPTARPARPRPDAARARAPPRADALHFVGKRPHVSRRRVLAGVRAYWVHHRPAQHCSQRLTARTRAVRSSWGRCLRARPPPPTEMRRRNRPPSDSCA